MRVVFMGTPEYATVILKSLLEYHEVVGVFTQPDKKAGRKGELKPPHVKEFLSGLHVEIFQPTTLKDESVQESIKALKPDVVVVAAYGQILPQAVLDIAPCINLHASILPKYRGASPIQSALLESQKLTGVTAMMMERGLDTGDMLGFSYVKIDDKTTLVGLFDELSIKAGELTLKVLEDFSSLNPLKQHHCLSSYSPKITKEDGVVSFELTSEEFFAKYQGLTPWPSIYLEGGLKLVEIKKIDIDFESSGKIIDIRDDGVIVSCKRGSILVKSVHAPSKKVVSGCNYISGRRIKIGDNFS